MNPNYNITNKRFDNRVYETSQAKAYKRDKKEERSFEKDELDAHTKKERKPIEKPIDESGKGSTIDFRA